MKTSQDQTWKNEMLAMLILSLKNNQSLYSSFHEDFQGVQSVPFQKFLQNEQKLFFKRCRRGRSRNGYFSTEFCEQHQMIIRSHPSIFHEISKGSSKWAEIVLQNGLIFHNGQKRFFIMGRWIIFQNSTSKCLKVVVFAQNLVCSIKC